MGEFEFIETVRRAFAGIGDETIIGIGDDCAVIPLSDSSGEAFVVTTDMLVEGVHFLRDHISARELGAKSLAVNLSDIAAMGARPVASFLSIALPRECRGEWVDEFMAGYREMSERHCVKLAGGDTTGSLGAIAINEVAIGRAPLGHLKYRSGALPGDIIAVNGALGESAAGLKEILEQNRLASQAAGRPRGGAGGDLLCAEQSLLAAIHRNPIPQVEEGAWLGERVEVHAMMDLSDGLASDLGHILKGSGVGAEIELTAIPTPVDVELAVTGGEDYKLLMTVAPEKFATLAADYKARFGATLYAVGRILPPRRPQGSAPLLSKEGNLACGEKKTYHPADHKGRHPSFQEGGESPAANAIVWLENGVRVEKNWRGFTHF
jgi:thiamine-monophosphate kinase